MNAVRWILATVTAIVATAFVAFVLHANGFRRSFGASDNGPLVMGVPLAVMLVLLTSLLLPGQRILLHAAAVVAVGLAVCSVWMLRESVFLGVMGLAYCGLWSAWYWHITRPLAGGLP
jgi:hypothetical protein